MSKGRNEKFSKARRLKDGKESEEGKLSHVRLKLVNLIQIKNCTKVSI